jgi:hypothetical protein
MDISSFSFRKEVLDYLRCFENLLAALSEPKNSWFSKDELEVLGYSVAELQKVLVACDKQ